MRPPWKILAVVILTTWAFLPVPANAQATVRICIPTSTNVCTPVTASDPLPTTGAGGVVGLDPNQTAAGVDQTCGSASSSCVLKASAGKFYGAYANCTAACWLMVFNSVSAPSNGATTAGKGNVSGDMTDCIPIAAGGANSITYPVYPKSMTVGITVAISSTACATLTLSAVGFVSGLVE